MITKRDFILRGSYFCYLHVDKGFILISHQLLHNSIQDILYLDKRNVSLIIGNILIKSFALRLVRYIKGMVITM